MCSLKTIICPITLDLTKNLNFRLLTDQTETFIIIIFVPRETYIVAKIFLIWEYFMLYSQF